MDDHDADVQRPQERHVQEKRREVLVGDDRAVNRQNERLLAKLWDVLEDAPQVCQLHHTPRAMSAINTMLPIPCHDSVTIAPPRRRSPKMMATFCFDPMD